MAGVNDQIALTDRPERNADAVARPAVPYPRLNHHASAAAKGHRNGRAGTSSASGGRRLF
jgi:hypothetical protein